MSSLSDQFGASRSATAPTAELALQNIEAELGFLTDLLASNRLIEPAADHIRPVDFAVPLHGTVFATMLAEVSAGRAVDAVTLAPILNNEEGWQVLYRRFAAADLNAGSADRTKAYLNQIVSMAKRRRVVKGLSEVITSARSLDTDHQELMLLADEAVAELADGTKVDEHAPVADHARKVIDSFGRPVIGIQSGIRSLDKATGIIRPGNKVVLGARPGMGKTAVAGGYCLGAARRGHGTLLISLEMSADELTRRVLADMCFTHDDAIPYEDIKEGRVTGRALNRVKAASRDLDRLPFEIAEPAGLTIAKLIRLVRRQRRKFAARGQKLDLVVLDYLQLMTPSREGMKPYEAVSEISRGLKQLARSENIVVMALAQLNRDLERREDKRPIKADLRDSGTIEQDADLIIFLYREEEYLLTREPEPFDPKFEAWRTEMQAVRNKIEFIIDKNRHGRRGKAMGWFFADNQAVRSADFYSDYPEELAR